MSRLWDRGSALDQRIERFTVGRDPELDLRLVPFDALASAAHATMLKSIEVLGEDELASLLEELRQVAIEARDGTFVIAPEDEDGHTALENRLTARLGDAGRRIHTGRSRNDQVIGALRLWAREAIVEQASELLELVKTLLEIAHEQRETSLPGYTHTRQAMPSTLGFLFAAHASNLLDNLPWLRTAFRHADRSPLGSASGYGVALPLDRRQVAILLAFSRLQANTLSVQNDRGKTEMLVLGAGLASILDLSSLASDLIWFSSDELRFVRLDDAVTTGSSIMPQKRNPDVLELIRATAARVRSRHGEIASVYGPLSAGYHRDLQLTKEPFLESMQAVTDALAVMRPVLTSCQVDRDRCRQAMARSIGATDAVYERVAAGEPFRSAYKEVAQNPEAAVPGDPSETWRKRIHDGAPGALDLEPLRTRVAQATTWVEERKRQIRLPWSLLRLE